MADDIFAGQTPPSESALDKLVGEGKKYKSAEDLANAYLNADSHIGELKTDLQTTREFISEELKKLAEQRTQAPPAPNPETRSIEPAPVAPPASEVEDLDTKIAKVLEEKETLRRLQDNANTVQEVLVERLGGVEKAAEAVIAKARELGLNPADMKEMAAKSPKAFFATMGIDPNARSNSTPAPSSDVSPHRIGSPIKAETYAYYENIRKTDPKLYWQPATQKAMHAAAQRLGTEFFN